jgi:glycosidase
MDDKMISHFILMMISIFLLSCENIAQPKIDRAPQWAKEAVWYQIFPERFRNGDPANDPTVQDMAGGWPYFEPESWQVLPWTSDWYKLQPWENNTGKGFYWETGLRRYGGDLQGVIDKLDYLQELGVNAIYFNPLFESPSLHKYDASMYRHIDNNFGPDPEGDRALWARENPADAATWQWSAADSLFLKLLQECHNRGIRVIIDGVFNHVGNTFWAFKDVEEKQQNSPYQDWFIIKSWDNPATPDTNEFVYQGWNGVRDLPEIREDENGLVGGIREHIHTIVRRWMDPNGDGDPSDGIDGWRLDVAEMVDLNFWRTFRGWVKEINPEAFLTGEVWWEDWQNNRMFNAAPWLEGDAFDAVMNYRFAAAVKQFVIDVNTQITAQEFVDKMQAIRADYHPENYAVLQNLISSHDVDRLASQIVNPDRWYDHEARPGQTNDYDVRKPNETERLKQKLIAGLQMTLPGAPMIYYGDEAGMWGSDDPDCRKPMVWPDLEYEDEISHPFGKSRLADAVVFDAEIFGWYRRFIAIRKANSALADGELDYFMIDNANKTIGFLRTSNSQPLFIYVNNSKVSNSVLLDLRKYSIVSSELKDLLTDKIYSGIGSEIQIVLQPYQIVILKP